MDALSIEEKVFLIECFYSRGKNYSQAYRGFRSKYGSKKVSSETILRRIIDNFGMYGTLNDRRHDLPGPSRTVTTDETIDDVRNYFDKNSNTSIRKAAQVLDLKRETLRKIMRDVIKLHPYKITTHQLLTEKAMEKQVEFCKGRSDAPVVGVFRGIVPASNTSSSSKGLAELLVTSDSAKPVIVSNEEVNYEIREQPGMSTIGKAWNDQETENNGFLPSSILQVQLQEQEQTYRPDINMDIGASPGILPEVTITPVTRAKIIPKKKVQSSKTEEHKMIDYMDLTANSDNASVGNESAASSRKTAKSGSSCKQKKIAKKRKCRKTMENSSSEEEGATRGGLDLNYDQRLEAGCKLAELADSSTAEILAEVTGWLKEVDESRAKSKNLKGNLDRKIKVNTHATMEAIDLLAKRAIHSGDTKYLQEKVNKLGKEITLIKHENELLKKRLNQIMATEKEILSSPTKDMESISHDKEVSYPIVEEMYVPLAIRPPVKGVSKVIDEGKILRNRVIKGGKLQFEQEVVLENIPPMTTVTGTRGQDQTCEILTAINGLTMVVQNLVQLQYKGTIGNKEEKVLLEQNKRAEILDKNKKRTKNKSLKDNTILTQKRTGITATKSSGVATSADPTVTATAAPSADKSTAPETEKRVNTKEMEIGKNDTQQQNLPWNKVVGRKARKGRKEEKTLQNIPPPIRKGKEKSMLKSKERRLMRTSAVTITRIKGNTAYSEILKEAQAAIDLNELGITDIKTIPSYTGGMVIEIPGEESKEKANILAERLRKVFEEREEIKIGRPTQKMDLRISELDESATSEGISQIAATVGGCHKDDIRCGPIRRYKRGMGSIWLQMPAIAAIKLAKEAKIRVGWTTAKVEVLQKRPLQCYRCLARGHTRNRCPPENIDRSSHCYNCGEIDHKAEACTRKVSCLICKSKGLKDGHKVGSPECPPCPPSKWRPNESKLTVQ
nr:PREDICTED: uncharacterized protein LOC105673432 [Linepithema humile]